MNKMKWLTIILAISFIARSSTKSCQDLLHHDDDDDDKRALRGTTEVKTRLFYRESDADKVESAVEHYFPGSEEETHHCRFDINHLAGHTSLINQLHSAGYKLCIGCEHHHDPQKCHFVYVCSDDAVCINGSYTHPNQIGIAGVHTQSWYGCCEKGKDDCEASLKHISVHGKNIDYRFHICDGPICNAGPPFVSQVSNFNGFFNGPAVPIPYSANSNWSSWGSWSACDCSTLSEKRTRTCREDWCDGTGTDHRHCHVNSSCPVNGGWTNYSNWTACNVTCGGGMKSRVRYCTNPHPQNGGQPCIGDQYDYHNCHTQPCPVWQDWSNWTSCFESNGHCWKARNRNCSTGLDSDCHTDPSQPIGQTHEVTSCDPNDCAQAWTAWSQPYPCKLTGAACFSARTRNCSTGDIRNCSGSHYEVLTCDPQCCNATALGKGCNVSVASTSSPGVTSANYITSSATGISTTKMFSSSAATSPVKSSTSAFSSAHTSPTTKPSFTTRHIYQVTSGKTVSSASPSSSKIPITATSSVKSTVASSSTLQANISTTSTVIPTATKLPVINTNLASTSQSVVNVSIVRSTTPAKVSASFTKSPLASTSSAASVQNTAVVTKQSASANIYPNTSTAPSVARTTMVATIPPKAITCAKCAGPPEACELAFYEDTCQPPNHYCINHVTNLASGERLIERKCGNIRQCYHDWYLGTSDDDKCRQLSSSTVLTYQFECTFCCITDGCNVDLQPQHSTLYTNTG